MIALNYFAVRDQLQYTTMIFAVSFTVRCQVCTLSKSRDLTHAVKNCTLVERCVRWSARTGLSLFHFSNAWRSSPGSACDGVTLVLVASNDLYSIYTNKAFLVLAGFIDIKGHHFYFGVWNFINLYSVPKYCSQFESVSANKWNLSITWLFASLCCG